MKFQSVRFLAKTAATAAAISALAACTLGGEGGGDKVSGVEVAQSLSWAVFQPRSLEVQDVTTTQPSDAEIERLFKDLEPNNVSDFQELFRSCTASLFVPDVEEIQPGYLYFVSAVHCFEGFMASAEELKNTGHVHREFRYEQDGDAVHLIGESPIWSKPPVMLRGANNTRLRATNIWFADYDSALAQPSTRPVFSAIGARELNDYVIIQAEYNQDSDLGRSIESKDFVDRLPRIATAPPTIVDPSNQAYPDALWSHQSIRGNPIYVPPTTVNAGIFSPSPGMTGSCIFVREILNYIQNTPSILANFPWIAFDAYRCSSSVAGFGYGAANRILDANWNRVSQPNQNSFANGNLDGGRYSYMNAIGQSSDVALYVGVPQVPDQFGTVDFHPTFLSLFFEYVNNRVPQQLNDPANALRSYFELIAGNLASDLDQGAVASGGPCSGDSGMGLYEPDGANRPMLRSVLNGNSNPCAFGYAIATELSSHASDIKEAVIELESLSKQ